MIIFASKFSMTMENSVNQPKKDYCEPMHTCEHILNQTMVRMFGCPRSMNAHIEKKKSKCDYTLPQAPTEVQIWELTNKVNEIIDQHLPVTIEFMDRAGAAQLVDLSKLPAEATETLRIIRVGNYDACACIGQHVENTSELGHFEIISHDFENGRWRVRFKLV
jgi:misacylated tRNA(Ala) deacylase